MSPSLKSKHGPRRGFVTLWVILFAPLLLILVCFVADIGKLWLARAELNSALEAAALSAVLEWGSSGGTPPTLPARTTGATVAGANMVDGSSVSVALNHEPGNLPNENDACEGLIFGSITATAPDVEFDAAVAPNCAADRPPAVHAVASQSVDALCDNLFGSVLGPFRVTVEVTAVYDCNTGSPKIIHVDRVMCP